MSGARVVVVAAVAVAATLVVVFALSGEPTASGPPASGPAAEGWRWESYGGVEVQVPADWGHGTTNWPACVDQPKQAYVGRPGAIPLVGCSWDVVPLDKRVSYLWFDSRAGAGVRAHDAGWVEETRIVGEVHLTVLSDDPTLRARILDSARTSSEDAAGACPADHRVTTGHDVRPDPGPGGLGAVGTAESITVCRYALRNAPTPTGSRILSTSQLTGEPAQALVRAILAAPEGNGPNDPGNCVPEVAYGDEVLMLTVRGSAHSQEVFVRYSGCDGHGLDDGHTQRRLTAEVLKPLLSGPHQPGSLSGSVAELVWPN